VGGWQVAGLGSLASTYLTLPANMFRAATNSKYTGTKYPIQDCTSGACYPPGYLWYKRLHSGLPDKQRRCERKAERLTGIQPITSPVVQPLLPYRLFADYLSAGCELPLSGFYAVLSGKPECSRCTTGSRGSRRRWCSPEWGTCTRIFRVCCRSGTCWRQREVRARQRAQAGNLHPPTTG